VIAAHRHVRVVIAAHRHVRPVVRELLRRPHLTDEADVW